MFITDMAYTWQKNPEILNIDTESFMHGCEITFC